MVVDCQSGPQREGGETQVSGTQQIPQAGKALPFALTILAHRTFQGSEERC